MAHPGGRARRPYPSEAHWPSWMRVVHLLPAAMTNHGPTGGVLAQLRGHGSEVTSEVWSLYAPPADREVTVGEGVSAVRCMGMRNSFLDLSVLRPLTRHLRRARPDILHCHLIRASLYGRLAARLAGVEVVVSHFRQVEAYFTSVAASARGIRAVESWTGGLVTAYVSVSEGVRQAAIHCLGIPPRRIRTILNGVDIDGLEQDSLPKAKARNALGLPKAGTIVGVAAVLEERKNIPALVRVIAELHHEGREWLSLAIAGEGPDRERIEREIVRSDARHFTHLVGFQRRIAPFLSCLDVFALPSLSEGLPRAVMESLACGVPAVVSDAGGSGEAVLDGQTGFVFPVGDDGAMRSKIARLVDDAAMRAQCSTAARADARRRLSCDRLTREHEALYFELLEGRVG